MDALLTDKRNVGIRIIVAAEKEAQQIVNAARTGKYFNSFRFNLMHGMEYPEDYCRLKIVLST